MGTHLVWFRNDLRLHDHRPLWNACRAADQIPGDDVVPIYIVEPRQFGRTSFGFAKCGPHRTRFLADSLRDLDRQLHSVGARLRLMLGRAEDVFEEVCRSRAVSNVYFYREVATEEAETERHVIAALRRLKVKTNPCLPDTLCEWDSLPFKIAETPEVFTNFRRQVEKRARIDRPLPAPSSIPSVPHRIEGEQDLSSLTKLAEEQSVVNGDSHRATMQFTGGETAGRNRVAEYIWEKDLLKQYKLTRNGMLRADDSSKISPWLAHGCISARWVFDEVRRYEEERVKNDSTYWLKFELLWRDYFAFMGVKHGGHMFRRGGIRREQLPWRKDWHAFEAWRRGSTGFPLIDANMRELAASGFMSNRGRQNVASFLTKNLGVDWRMGAEWFESMLIDYDPCSNYGNWNYLAGIGNDARGFRWFNPLKQAKDYDPEGLYVKHWLPELSEVPVEFVHCPWRMSEQWQQQSRCVLGRDYPKPIVDLFESAEENRQRYEASVEKSRRESKGLTARN